MTQIRLTTDRLVLRMPEARDLEAFTAYSLSDRTRFVGGPRTAFTAVEKFAALIGHWSLRGFGRLIITEAGNDQGIGHVGPFNFMNDPEPELSWTLWSAAHEGQGLASEAALAAVLWMRDGLGMTRAVTSIHRDNHASARIAQKLGGVRTGAEAPHLAGAEVWDFDLTALQGATMERVN